MEQKVDKLKDSLVFILDKLENMEKQVRKQEQEIENYIKKNRSIDFNELVAAHLKSTKTSIELLREEIDELHQLIIPIIIINAVYLSSLYK
jgi:hypothetical protein